MKMDTKHFSQNPYVACHSVATCDRKIQWICQRRGEVVVGHRPLLNFKSKSHFQYDTNK